MSYLDMVKDTSADMKGYLRWILLNAGCNKSPKVDDLANYLRAIKWGQSGENTAYPGTTETRVFK